MLLTLTFAKQALSGFVADSYLKLTLNVEVVPEGGLSEQKIEDTKLALRELGLQDDVNVS
jgi:hypothetical protein